MSGRFGSAAVGLAGVAARLLGWRPDDFWNATPAELAAALGTTGGEGAGRDELGALMQRFPDEKD